jgi:hypothetical protein
LITIRTTPEGYLASKIIAWRAKSRLASLAQGHQTEAKLHLFTITWTRMTRTETIQAGKLVSALRDTTQSSSVHWSKFIQLLRNLLAM